MMKAKKRLTNFSSNPYKTNIKLKTMNDYRITKETWVNGIHYTVEEFDQVGSYGWENGDMESYDTIEEAKEVIDAKRRRDSNTYISSEIIEY